ncbi:protein kinase, partial [Streptomyces sp. NPDC056528]|uniref:protein kinase n=1 Tax=Streptomyces sp. NPDC056528 TaxID=3345854 RepID=UPI0036A80161
MDDYAGRVLADRYRLPLPPADGTADGHDLTETRAFDTYSGQEVLVRQVPLPEFVDAEVLDEAEPGGLRGGAGRPGRGPAEPVVRRAIEAAQAAAQIPDHPLLDQVFDVFAEAGSLWIVSERVAASRPLAALLAERPLNPYRAAEIGADVLTALRALHAHGWVHRNITSRTVLVCDDGRVVLSGLAVGAAEEALCGYAPVPEQDGPDAFAHPDAFAYAPAPPAGVDEETDPDPYAPDPYDPDPYAPDPHGPDAYEADTYEPGVYEAETYAPGPYEAETHEPDAEGPETHGPGAHGSGAYALEPYAADTYETEVYAPERYTPEGLAPVEDYRSETYGSEEYRSEEYRSGESGSGTAHGSGAYRPEEHRPEPYALEAPDGGVRTGDGTDGANGGTDDGAEGRSGGGAGSGGSAPGPRPAPDAYGADPYGKSAAAPAGTRPQATPPTADVRAARAGAIAAYRAGARAAARLGETGALPAQ